ncbi:hypothetical protein B296_00007118 [Ensete ventricosum]|uniref:Uncharacterized protein n=1 Tax=Ensete ventricosum TaxID=4639 RepID=A0A427AD46_ENSVE|nr:hypothetical protein B296_00007118 [Ensete ventricosum]
MTCARIRMKVKRPILKHTAVAMRRRRMFIGEFLVASVIASDIGSRLLSPLWTNILSSRKVLLPFEEQAGPGSLRQAILDDVGRERASSQWLFLEDLGDLSEIVSLVLIRKIKRNSRKVYGGEADGERWVAGSRQDQSDWKILRVSYAP